MRYEDVVERLHEIRHGRTRFQLEKFVVGQHRHPVMRYQQIVVETEALMRETRRNELEVERLLVEAEELDSTGIRSKQIAAEQNRIKAGELAANIALSKREIESLLEMLDEYPRYTMKDIERVQPDYWRERLLTEANLQVMATGSVGYGHLEALMQAGLLSEIMAMNPQEEIAKLAMPELEGESDD